MVLHLTTISFEVVCPPLERRGLGHDSPRYWSAISAIRPTDFHDR